MDVAQVVLLVVAAVLALASFTVRLYFDMREVWFERARWAIDHLFSGDPRRYTAALGEIERLHERRTPDRHDRAMLQSVLAAAALTGPDDDDEDDEAEEPDEPA